jgi:hypothetical protein
VTLRSLSRQLPAVFGGVLLAAIVLVALLAPVIAPAGPRADASTAGTVFAPP